MLKRLAGYFLRGLLLLLPSALTVYLIILAIRWVDGFFDFGIPGLGLVVVVVGITMVGFLFTGFFGQAVFGIVDELMSRTPLVKLIYSSLKDLIEAFVGEKKRFNEPVLVTLAPNVQFLGFVTRKDLSKLGLQNKVAVYFPYSYAITGHLLIVPGDSVSPVHTSATEVMKFLVSGGVTGLQGAAAAEETEEK